MHRFARRIKNGGLVLRTEATLKKNRLFVVLFFFSVLLWHRLGLSVRVYIQDIAPQPAPPTFLSPEHSDYHFPAPSCRTRSARNKVAMRGKSRLTVSADADTGPDNVGSPLMVMVNEADKQGVPRLAL